MKEEHDMTDAIGELIMVNRRRKKGRKLIWLAVVLAIAAVFFISKKAM